MIALAPPRLLRVQFCCLELRTFHQAVIGLYGRGSTKKLNQSWFVQWFKSKQYWRKSYKYLQRPKIWTKSMPTNTSCSRAWWISLKPIHDPVQWRASRGLYNRILVFLLSPKSTRILQDQSLMYQWPLFIFFKNFLFRNYCYLKLDCKKMKWGLKSNKIHWENFILNEIHGTKMLSCSCSTNSLSNTDHGPPRTGLVGL